MRRVRLGDERAWTALVQKHQAAVFRLAYLRLGDADEAADAAQEAFIRAYAALATFDETRPLRPWLLAIVSRLAANRRRSAGRALAALRRWLGTDQGEMLARQAADDSSGGPGDADGRQASADLAGDTVASDRHRSGLTAERVAEAETLSSIAAEGLWKAVRRLTDTDQDVLMLRFFMELSEHETAQALAVAEGTVKSRTHRALARLRREVERDRALRLEMES